MSGEEVAVATSGADTAPQEEQGTFSHSDSEEEGDTFLEGAPTRLGALRVWIAGNTRLAALLCCVLFLSLVLFAIGIYCHAKLDAANIYSGLNAVPWLAAMLTCLAVLLFLPTHLQSNSADGSCPITCWTVCIALSLVLDLLTMCFAAANASEDFLLNGSQTKSFAIVLAVLYGILSLLLALGLLAYLGCFTVLRQKQQGLQRRRRASTQPLASSEERRAPESNDHTQGSQKLQRPPSLDFASDDPVRPDLEEFARTAPATGGASGGAIAARPRPTSQVFSAGSPTSINASM